MIVSTNFKFKTFLQIVLNIMSNKTIKNVTMMSADEILSSIVELYLKETISTKSIASFTSTFWQGGSAKITLKLNFFKIIFLNNLICLTCEMSCLLIEVL